MSYSMVAVTADGTRFGCAGISLTETGLAVLNEGGSRLGFVPYDSLNYVTPTAADGETETDASMTVVATDGAEFGCASISQTSAGVATLSASGSRTGFVPYGTLQYVLPPEKTGEELPPDCPLPPGVSGDEEEGGVWEDGDENADGGSEDGDGNSGNADNPGEDGGGSDDGESGSDGHESDDEECSDEEEDGIWEDAEESTESVDPDAPVVEDEAESDAEADGDTEAEGEAEAGSAADEGDDEEDREAAGESEMKVEWSFGEYEE